jgi:EF-hand domain
LQAFLTKYDKDKDQKITIDEFKILMEEKFKSDMLTSESIIDDLKREFKKIDLENKRLLSIG